MSSDAFGRACHAGALAQIEDSLKERIKRLKELADKMPQSLKRAREETGEDLPPQIKAQQQALIDRWPETEAMLKSGPPTAIGEATREKFLKEWEQASASSDHVKAVGSLARPARETGTAWLQEIVDSASTLWDKK